MRSVWTFFKEFANPVRHQRWLMLGKGPSFARRTEIPLGVYLTLGLNHVVDSFSKLDLLHVTDLEVLEQVNPISIATAKAVVMPWFPHIKSRPRPNASLGSLLSGKSPACAPERAGYCRVLRDLDAAGKLYCYKSSRSGFFAGHPSIGPSVRVRYFSAVAGVNLLAVAGVKTIRMLGIDGGKAYSPDFNHLKPLSNGRDSFDVQFKELDLAASQYQLDLKKFDPKEFAGG